jgi:tetratricopeptide (TPR) repeat protein
MLQATDQIPVLTYLAVWDEKVGPEIYDAYPEANANSLDLDEITLQIFQSFQIIFGTNPDVHFNRTNLSFPLKSLKRIAKIMLDSIPNENVRGGLQPFIVVFLVPEDFSEENLNAFNDILIRIGLHFSKEKRIKIKEYYDEIKTLYQTQSVEKDENIVIEPNYSLSTAVNDLKMGIGFFQKLNFTSAYHLIRKALIKFQEENQKSLIMECNFLLGTILFQKKKFGAALQYYKKLGPLSTELGNQKFMEQAPFMSGYCSFKLENYSEALTYFDRMNINEMKFVNKFQYFSILGKTYDSLGMNVKAIEALKNALVVIESVVSIDEGISSIQKKEEALKQKAQISYELGVQHYRIGIVSLSTMGYSKKDVFQNYMNGSIKYLENSIEFLGDLKDFRTQIPIFKLISTIYGLLKDNRLMLDFLSKGMKAAELGNDIGSQIGLFNRIIQINNDLGYHEENSKAISNMFDKLGGSLFVDLISLAGYHYQLGVSLNQVGREDEGLSQFLVALNIYNKMESSVPRHLDVLNNIIQYYTRKNDEQKRKYYQNLYDKVAANLAEISKIAKKDYRFLGELKEFWIILATGTEMFSYTPETKFDPDLLGGFMTAMQSFSMELSSQKLNSIVIGNDRYNIIKDEAYAFFILGRSSIKSQEKRVVGILNKIASRFQFLFGEALKEFSGDVLQFRKFMDEVMKMDLDLV